MAVDENDLGETCCEIFNCDKLCEILFERSGKKIHAHGKIRIKILDEDVENQFTRLLCFMPPRIMSSQGTTSNHTASGSNKKQFYRTFHS